MKYIDAHAHAYRKTGPFSAGFFSPEKLLEKYDKFGIEAGFLLPVVSPEVYLPQTNEDILEICEKYPRRFLPYCNIDPRAISNRADAPLDRLLEYYKSVGCYAVGEIMPNLSMDDPRVQNLFRCAEKTGLPVTTDGSDRIGGDFGLCDFPGLPLLEHTLQCFPNLRYIAHGPVFWAEITERKRPALCKPAYDHHGCQKASPSFPAVKLTKEGVAQELLREFPNLYAELSDAYWILRKDEDFAIDFLIEFQDKLFFGTDACASSSDINFEIKLWFDYLHESGKLPENAWKKICRNNIINFFNLHPYFLSQ